MNESILPHKFHTLRNVRIAGLRVSLPTNTIRLEDELQYYGGSAKKVARLKATLGMDQRRVCPPDVTASDLCAHAATDLLAAFPHCKADIDALVFLTQSPDWRMPATACELQHRLDLPVTCAAFDVNQGCAGYVYGLWIAASLVAAGSARNVLLLVGDTPSLELDVRNRNTAPVFGDAGSATLLTRDENAPPMHFGLGNDGSGFEAIIEPGGRARIPFLFDVQANACLGEALSNASGNVSHLTEIYMDGGDVFNFTMNVVPEHILTMLEYAHTTPQDIDWLMLHQANRQIVANIAEKTGFCADKAPSGAFSRYGNCAATSIATSLAHSLGTRPAPGRLLLCGFGIGLAWASCMCEVDQWDCRLPLDYEPNPIRPTRQQRIARWQQILRGERTIHD